MRFLRLRQAGLHLIALERQQPGELLGARQEMPRQRFQAFVREQFNKFRHAQSGRL